MTDTAARRIVRKHNEYMRNGFDGNGKLVFDLEGGGGYWYSDGSYGLGDDVYVVNVGRKALTMRDIQERFTPRYR